jgi:hypothetical protein
MANIAETIEVVGEPWVRRAPRALDGAVGGRVRYVDAN